MSTSTVQQTEPPTKTDYSLTGLNHTLAIEKGLAEADWYQCHVPRDSMRKLLERRDGPAIRDTVLWFALILGSAYATVRLWGTGWAVLPYIVYCVLYSSTSDSRWHESSHGTAFKTDWMNQALYEIASFMVMRESTVWRWSHNRHHSDTIIVGRDPEIVIQRPPDIKAYFLQLFNLLGYPNYFKHLVAHALGRKFEDEKTFIPDSEFSAVFRNARIVLAIYVAVIGVAIYEHSVLPILFVGLANLFGSWLMPVYGFTQHAGLAENVLDHRLNCRTVYMNPVNRFLYWNMNYHVEHHMFPLVPYHALPRLHEAVKDDCPIPYPNLFVAWKEIVPTLRRQVKDPAFYVKRRLPESKPRVSQSQYVSDSLPDIDGWVDVCAAGDLKSSDIIRFDHGRKSYALYRDAENTLFATDGMCTHGNTHLADGLLIGKTIECPKHNGRFNLVDGSPARIPVCVGVATYPILEREGRVRINTSRAEGAGARAPKRYKLRVVSNRSVATFIKELILEPIDKEEVVFAAGDYLQIVIPNYSSISFREFDIPEPYAAVWERNHLFDLVAKNAEGERRNNYSFAGNLKTESTLRLNVRIATPPPGQDCLPGIGSSYVFSLKPGDTVEAMGPFGDFHIKPTQREMVYIGGGAGMAPLRAHLSHLFETANSSRKVSFWYGARSRQELFYEDYFRQLERDHPNFTFHQALSSPLDDDNWNGHVGFIHDVTAKQYLREHPNLGGVEFYLCGPPQMIKACNRVLTDFEVPTSHIAYDEF